MIDVYISVYTYFRKLGGGLVLLLLLGFPASPVLADPPALNKTQLLADRNKQLPLANLASLQVLIVSPSEKVYAPFAEQVSKYIAVNSTNLNKYSNTAAEANTILVVAQRRELSSAFLARLRTYAAKGKRIIFCELGGSSYDLPVGLSSGMIYLRHPAINETAQQELAMSVFGGLPITNGPNKREQTRLQYLTDQQSQIPLDLNTLTKKIDAIADEAIQAHAAPGMVVMVVKNGAVLLEKAYGYHTYDKKEKTRPDDIFDLASISKIVGTTPLVMHLYEQHRIQLDSTLGYYLPAARNTNKATTTLRRILLHEGGFEPYIPFYRDLKEGDMQRTASKTHQIQLADHAFLKNRYYEEVMWPRMLASPIRDAGKYVYSDISMYAMKEVAETVTGTSIDRFLQDWLFSPIGMQTAGYNPRTRFAKRRLVPTEDDRTFRKELLQGYVHDQGAAMANGVAGHAGLFASANDLAIYAQMLLNRGNYGGVRYFQPATVDLFTSRQSKSSRRGLGFDRYDLDASKAYPSRFANESVYGHTGFTGTCLWIDPKHQLVYIFLSNRVYPDVSNTLYDLNIRSRIQDAIYEALNDIK